MNKLVFSIFLLSISCTQKFTGNTGSNQKTAKNILGNSNYQAISYGGYRDKTRDIEPTLTQLTEDLRILSAMNIKVVRTYNVHHTETADLLKAIRALKKENPGFEMYVMLGAWIDCKNAWTANPPIRNEDSERNAVEIAEAVKLANEIGRAHV